MKKTERVAILCCGPSLGNVDLKRIDCPTIGVNMSYLAMQSFYHVFTAAALVYGHKNQLHTLTPDTKRRFVPVASSHCEVPRQIAAWSYTAISARRSFPDMPVPYDLMQDGWVTCGGAPTALQVAVGLGYKEVIFCGLDLRIINKIHFYPDREFAGLNNLSTVSQRRIGYAVQLDCLMRLQPWVEKLGVQVFNTGAAQVFDNCKFDWAFS